MIRIGVGASQENKQVRRRRRTKKIIPFPRIRKEVDWVVAIDCSLHSTGIVVHHQPSGRYQMVGWAQNAKQYADLAPLNDERVHILPPYQKYTDHETDLRLEDRSEAILQVIYGAVGHSPNVVVAFEGLPFALEHTSSRVQLTEILTLTRHKCFLAGWRLYMVMPPTIKKKWTGYGNAQKPDMLKEYLKRFPMPTERPRFFQHPTNINPDKIVHPSEDLIDAFALCSILLEHNGD